MNHLSDTPSFNIYDSVDEREEEIFVLNHNGRSVSRI